MSVAKKPAKVEIRKSTMSVSLDIGEMKTLEECFPFEPDLAASIRRAERKKKRTRFEFVLRGDDRTEVLDVLKAGAEQASKEGRLDKSIDFLVLHDKIVVFTPEDFEI